MKKKITPAQENQFKKLMGDAVASLGLSKEGAQFVLGHKDFQRRLRQLIVELSGEFYRLLTDEEAIVWLVKHAKKSRAEATKAVNAWRQKARAAGVADNVRIHAEVLPGATLKRDIPRMGPCWDGFQYLQNWNFPDPPTEHALLSWVPAPLAGTTGKNADEQAAFVAAFHAESGLPEWCAVSFGSVGHLAGMVLAHFGATGVEPFGGFYTSTDTCRVDGRRLDLRWHEGRLRCGSWHWDEARDSDLAVFALGVTKALGR